MLAARVSARAGCGKSARPVRRGERSAVPFLSYSTATRDPRLAPALASPTQAPAPIMQNLGAERSQLSPVPRNRVILEIPPHHLPQPLAGLGKAGVHTPLQLGSNFLELGRQALAHRLPPYREVARLMVGPTDVGETQKVKGFRLPFSALFPTFSGIAPKLDHARLLRVQFQPELSQPLPKFFQETFCFGPLLEPQHRVVGVAHDDDIAARLLLPPLLHPEIQDVMQVEIRQDRRNDGLNAKGNVGRVGAWAAGEVREVAAAS